MQQGDLFPQEQTLPPVSDTLWARLTRSSFRSRFHLNCQDMTYLTEKGLPVVMEHGRDFIARRLAPANPKKMANKHRGKDILFLWHNMLQERVADPAWKNGMVL